MAERPTKAVLAKLIEVHQGNLSAITRALVSDGHEVTRQGLSLRLMRLGLAEEAQIQRALSGCPGPRPDLTAGAIDAVAERDAIAAEIRQGGKLEEIAGRLGISRRQLARKRQTYGLR